MAKKAPADPFSSVAADADRSAHQDTHIVPVVASDVKEPLIPYAVAKGKLEIPRFVRVPTWLFSGEYATLSSEAKILYIATLNNLSLSAKNGKVDDSGELYCWYTIESAQHLLRCGRTKANAVFSELRQHGLIRRVQQGQGKPARVYLYHPSAQPAQVNAVLRTKASTAVPADASTKLPASTPPPLPSVFPQSNSLLSAFFSQ